MFTPSRFARVSMLVLLAGGLAWQPVAARPQAPSQQTARLQQLRNDEASIIKERDWWLSLLNDPDMLLMARVDVALWSPDPFSDPDMMPVPVRRADAADFVAHQLLMMSVLHQQEMPITNQARIMVHLGSLSDALKQEYRRTLIPKFDDDLRDVRTEIQRITGTAWQPPPLPPPQPVVTPRSAPPGRAWYFRRALIQANQPTRQGFSLQDQEATPTGGHVEMAYEVNRGCYETYDMNWTFGTDVSRLRGGTKIPVTLSVSLMDGRCNSPGGSFIRIGAPAVEDFVMRQAPSNQPEWRAFSSPGGEAEARGTGPHSATVATTISVDADPEYSNGWGLFRIYAYVPGQFVTIAYLFLAGSS